MTGSTRTWSRTLFVVGMVLCIVLWTPAAAVGPMIGVGAAQQEGDQPSTPASYYGNVTIDGEPAPVGTEIEAVVDGEVKGNITVEEPGQYGGPDALDEKLLVSNTTNGSEVRFFADNANIERTEVTRTVPSPVEWEAGTVRKVDLQFASGSGLFDASIDSVDGPVVAGETTTLEASVENIAENTDTQVVNITLDGEVVAQREPELASNETVNITEVIATTTDDIGEAEIAVETVDDRAAETVTVQAPAEFNITKFETSNVGDAGESFGANVSVKNEGDVGGTQNVTLTYDGETVYDRARELDAGASETIDIPVETEAGEAGERNVIARTDDDREIRTVNLSAPAFFSVEVIEFDSDETVVEGQNITVVAEVRNTGGTQGSQDIEITKNGSTNATVQGVDLNAGESRTIEREIRTDSDDRPAVDIGVESDDDSDGLSVTVREPSAPTYEVDITGIPGTVNEPVTDGDETIDVTVTVENIGGETGEQDIDFAVDGDVRETKEDVELAGTAGGSGGSKTVTETIALERGDAPAVDVSVSSDNATATETVELTPVPEFVIDEIDVPNRVDADQEFTPSVTVENVGGQTTNATVGLFFNGSSVTTSRTGDLGADGTETVDFTLNATEQGVPDNITTQVEANVTNNATDEVDDFTTSRVGISQQEPANFTVNSLDLTPGSEVVAGNGVDIEAEIENTGEETGNQTVVLEFGGTEVAAEPVTLGGSETETVSATFTPGLSDIGDGIEVTANTDNDGASATIDVLEPASFDVEIVAIDEEVIAGDTLIADVRVRNTGEEDGAETDVTAFLNGMQANRTVTLDGGASTIESFEFQPTEADVGELDAVAVTPDTLDTETVTVGAPGELDIEFASVPEEITDEESFNATVRVENVGDGEVTERLTLEAEGLDASKAVTLDGGEVRRVELSDANVPSAGTTVAVRARSATDATGQRTVDITEAPTPPTFALSAPEAPASVLNPETGASTNVTVNTTVRNVGDNDGTQEIELRVEDEVVNRTEVSDLSPGDAPREVSLEFAVEPDDVGELEIGLSSENRTVTDTLVVEEADPAELDIVEVADAEPVDAGETFAVNVTVENLGDRDADAGAVTLESPTGNAAAVDAQPNGSETETVEVGVDVADAPRAGEFDREFFVSAGIDDATDAERTLTETVDYGSVRSGVAQAEPGDTVQIAPGTYTERDTVSVDTGDVVLEAASSDPTTVAPASDQSAVRIGAENVTLRGLTLEGDGNESAVVAENSATLESVEVNGWATGVESNGGEVTVESTLIESVDTGVELNSADPAEIAYATIRPDETGVLVTAEDALIRDSSIVGAQTGVDVVEAGNVRVERTTIRENTLGVRAFNVGETDSDTIPINASNLESNELSVLADGSIVDATDNWWGQSAGALPGDTLARSTVTTGDPLQNRVDSNFAVDLQSLGGLTNGNLERGESYTVPVEIENEGTKGDTQRIELDVSGGPTPPTQDVSVASGDTETVGFRLDVDRRFADSVGLTPASLDDDDSGNFDVIESDAIDLSVADAAINAEGSTTATVTEEFTDGFEEDVTGSTTITSADPGVATVDGNTIEAGGVGTATIEAEFTNPLGETLTDSIELSVVEAPDEEPQQPDEEEPPEDGTPDDDDDDEPPTTGGGGGGGGGVSVAPPESEVPTDVDVVAEETATPSRTQPGTTAVTFSEASSVESVAFESGEVTGSVTARTLGSEPESTGPSPGASAAVTQIVVPSGAEDTPATVRMRVSRDRLAEISADPGDLRVNRFNDEAGAWQGLPSDVAEETDDAVVVAAETPGFSYFSVSAVSEPEASIDAPGEVEAGTEITLDGSGSATEYGDIVAYEWSVDGESLDGETATTALEAAGEYTVELTVQNDAGETDTVTQSITVTEAEPDPTDGEGPADDGEPEPTDDEATDEPAELPGFGVGIALLALLAAALLARRRNT